jgi:glycosyltransferase involved in cell wall biosynthesis
MKLTNSEFTWNPLNLNDFTIVPWPKMEIIQMAIVGNLVQGKGHDTLFEVLSKDKWNNRNYFLNIYGNGEGERYLRDLCNFYQLTEKVRFKGFVSSATKIWQENHILLIPSSGEGLPISLVEAAICGRPAVVTDVGGNTEIIEEGITGFVACAPTVSSFSEALEKSWQNRLAWENMGLILKNNMDNILNKNPEVIILNKLLYKDE